MSLRKKNVKDIPFFFLSLSLTSCSRFPHSLTFKFSGHALYEQQRPAHVAGLPASAARSLGTNESQSLFWERHVGLTKSFAAYLAKKINEHFLSEASDSPTAEPEALYVALNAVKDPSFVRVEAGEFFFFSSWER